MYELTDGRLVLENKQSECFHYQEQLVYDAITGKVENIAEGYDLTPQK